MKMFSQARCFEMPPNMLSCRSRRRRGTLRLVQLSPKVVHRIVTGDVPPTLNTSRLREGIPHEWGEQERVLLGE